MAKNARLSAPDANGDQRIIDLIEGSAKDRFHPVVAAEFVRVPDKTNLGSVKNGTTWTHPDPDAPPQPVE